VRTHVYIYPQHEIMSPSEALTPWSAVACAQELRGKLLAEAEQSARHNAAVAMRWADLFSIEVPQDLYQEIEKQRQSCQKLISSKDKLIAGTGYAVHCCRPAQPRQFGARRLMSIGLWMQGPHS